MQGESVQTEDGLRRVFRLVHIHRFRDQNLGVLIERSDDAAAHFRQADTLHRSSPQDHIVRMSILNDAAPLKASLHEKRENRRGKDEGDA